MSNILVVEIGMAKVVHCAYGEHHVHAKLELVIQRGGTLKTSRFGPAIVENGSGVVGFAVMVVW
jgi:hypothetical protein